MKKTSPVELSDKQKRAEKMRKANADRAREAKECEKSNFDAAIRLSKAMGLPTGQAVAR